MRGDGLVDVGTLAELAQIEPDGACHGWSITGCLGEDVAVILGLMIDPIAKGRTKLFLNTIMNSFA